MELGVLTGKIAIVTGGRSGIGRATAKLLAREGAVVVIASRDAAAGEAAAAALVGPAGTASYLPCDVRDFDQCRRTVDVVVQRHGTIDVLFNNAGIIAFG